MRVKMAIAVVLTAAMASVGVGCTSNPTQEEAQWLGNGIFFIIYKALCDANYGVCPFPIAPSDPPPGG
jgi:hypothetical protein